MEYPCLENDVGEEVEGVAGGDIVLGEGHKDNHFIEALVKNFEPVRRVPWFFHCFVALFEFHIVTNTIVYCLYK